MQEITRSVHKIIVPFFSIYPQKLLQFPFPFCIYTSLTTISLNFIQSLYLHKKITYDPQTLPTAFNFKSYDISLFIKKITRYSLKYLLKPVSDLYASILWTEEYIIFI